MKKTFTIVALFLATVQISMAQNELLINYGYRNTAGSNLGNAFKAGNGFGTTFLHNGKQGKWAYGITLNTQTFSTSNDYFSRDYSAKFKNSNLLFSLRKEYKLKADHQLYWGVDAGLALNNYTWKKGGINYQENNKGLTAGFILGADWYITKYLSLDINGSYHRVKMNPLNFDDKFSNGNFKYISLNMGLRFSIPSL